MHNYNPGKEVVMFTFIILTEINKAVGIGQFYMITEGSIPLYPEQPFLDSEAFDCSRKMSCTKIARNYTLDREGEARNVLFAMNKIHEPSTVYQSCAEAMNVNGDKQGYYHIQLESMLHSIEIECKTMNKVTYSIIHHNNEMKSTVTGYEEPGSFRKRISYANSWIEVKKFISLSISCRQFTRFDCVAAVITYGGKIFAYLLDKDGHAMRYIGGGPAEGVGCACGITNSCAMNGTNCNCDANDAVHRYDSGYITQKDRLPLIEVRVGDTGSHYEVMSYTIGPVECWN